MKGFTKLGRTLLALTVLFILPLSDAMSVTTGNFIQALTGTYNSTCNGVIKLNANDGQIVVDPLNDLGKAAKPVPGVVHYAANNLLDQTVFGTFYYTSLYLDGTSPKTIEDGIFVTGEACGTFLTGYTNLGTYPYYATGGATTYGAGETFTYLSSLAQNIFPDEYAFLDLNGTGDKNITGTDVVTVTGEIILDGGALLAVEGTLNTGAESTLAGDLAINAGGEVNIGTGNITLSGTLDLNGDGVLNGGDGDLVANGAVTLTGPAAEINVGAGDMTFNSDLDLTDGTLTAGDALLAGDLGTVFIAGDATLGTNGNLDFGTNTFLEISGTIGNGGDGTNLAFDCSSTVTYNGAAGQLVMPTVSTNTYGNLLLDNGNKTMLTAASTSGYDVYLCGDFTLNGGGNFDIFKGGGVNNPGTLFMTVATKTANYAGLEEVVGTFNRATDGTGRTYTLNNALTEVTLATDAANPTNIQTLVLPGTAPEQYVGTTDVNRKITFSYTGNADVADDEFEYDMKVGYLLAEGPNAGAWGGLTTQTSLRMYEANAADKEKVGTGNTPVKTAASTGPDVMGSFSITGIKSALSTNTALPNGIGLFASTNDVLLTAGPTTFYSINDGRWTNPNTWDEGTLPTEDDNALIRHHVYAGIAGPFVGTLAAGNTTPEDVEYAGSVPAAYTIEVADIAGAAFILGNEDNGDGYVFRTKSTAGTTFMNNNTNPNAVAFGTGIAAKATYTASVQPFNGVWITNYGTTATRSSILKSNQISNTGTFNNEGVVEIGE